MEDLFVEILPIHAEQKSKGTSVALYKPSQMSMAYAVKANTHSLWY